MVRSRRISDLVRTADDVHTDNLVRQNRLRVDPVQTGLELNILGQGLDNTIIQNKWADECVKGKKKSVSKDIQWMGSSMKSVKPFPLKICRI